jgi:acyl-CoA hydrolase
MDFNTRKWVKPEDLNPNRSLFGGRLLQWIDEEAALYAIALFENNKVVTKYISEINFVTSAKEGDIIEIGLHVTKFGGTFVSLKCMVRKLLTRETILTIDRIMMVNLSEDGKPKAHGKTKVEDIGKRL